MPTVRAIVRQAANDDYRFEAIVKGIAGSDAFRTKLPPAAAPATPTQTAQATSLTQPMAGAVERAGE
jgi:hypothetical protein